MFIEYRIPNKQESLEKMEKSATRLSEIVEEIKERAKIMRLKLDYVQVNSYTWRRNETRNNLGYSE